MSMLSDKDISFALRTGKLRIEPLLEPIQPASVDMRLGPWLIHPRELEVYDPMHGSWAGSQEPMSFETFMLAPGGFVLGATLEWIEISAGLIGIMVGKSKLARIGLQIEAAGYFDPGWKGNGTLEIKNLGPSVIILRPGMTICQMRFEELSCWPQHLYGDPKLGSHFQGSLGPRAGGVDLLVPEPEPASAEAPDPA